MANLLKLYCDVANKRLVKSPFDSSIYTLPTFFNGDKVPIELQLLLPNDRGGLSSQFKPYEDAVAIELGLVDVAASPTERAALTPTQQYKLWSADVVLDGTGWNVGDTATVTTGGSGSGDTVPVIKITGATSGDVNSVEVLNEGIVAVTGTHPATGVTTTRSVYADVASTGLSLRVVWASIHTGVLDLSTSAFNTYMGSDLSKDTTFEIQANSGTTWIETIFQATVTVKADGFK
jgi:hypothetical protein